MNSIIKKVKNFKLNSLGLIYSDSNNIIFHDKNIIGENLDGASIYTIDEKLIQIYDKESGCYYYDGNTLIKSDYFLSKGVNNKILLATSNKRRVSMGNYECDIVNLKKDLINVNRILLENTLYDLILYTDKLYILSNFKSVLMFKLDETTQFWTYQFNFPKYYDEGYYDYRETQLEQFIGVYEDELWILFSGNRILVLDIHTGEERYQFESLNKTLDTSFFINNCFLDETTGVIKILAYLYYIEIDIRTKEASIKKEFKDFSMVNGSYYGGDTIYFVGNNNKSQSISNNITGIFNTKTLEIEWSYELDVKDKNHFFVDVPQVNATHFGVKDSENTLYLFERR